MDRCVTNCPDNEKRIDGTDTCECEDSHEKHTFGSGSGGLCVTRCTEGDTDTYRDTGTGNCRPPVCADDADVMNPGATLTLPSGKCIHPDDCSYMFGGFEVSSSDKTKCICMDS